MKPWLIGAVGVLVLTMVAVFLGDFLNRPQEHFEAVEYPDGESAEVTPQNTGGSRTTTPIAAPKPIKETVEAPPPSPAPSPSSTEEELTPKEKTLRSARPPEKSGPLDELKRAYHRESTDSSSREAEQQIRSLFGAEYLPVEMLRSINCRITVCKVSVYWTKANPLSYMALAMKVGYQQGQVVAIESAPEVDRKSRLPVDFYFLRSGHTLAEIQ